MDTIIKHMREINTLLDDSSALARSELPDRKASDDELVIEQVMRRHYRDVLSDLTLPRGRTDLMRIQTLQALDHQAAHLEGRLERRRRSRVRRPR